MRRVSVRMGRNFSPARKVRSITAPSCTRLSFVRTNAPPFPGFTCWNSTILKTVPSTSTWVPFLNWLVEITGGRLEGGPQGGPREGRSGVYAHPRAQPVDSRPRRRSRRPAARLDGPEDPCLHRLRDRGRAGRDRAARWAPAGLPRRPARLWRLGDHAFAVRAAAEPLGRRLARPLPPARSAVPAGRRRPGRVPLVARSAARPRVGRRLGRARDLRGQPADAARARDRA